MTFIKHINKAAVAAMSVLLSAVLASCNNDELIIDDNPETDGARPVTPHSSAWSNTVYEWTPAPGQFINESKPDVEWSESTTPEQAARWAQKRLDERLYVSLGAFGGYLTVGFDHSIVNTGDYDFGVIGNAFNSDAGSSNEPGIVYVMQDTNRNGLPDDEWFELKGSDTFAAGTIRDYSITYYRPQGDGMPVKWTDNRGNEGEIAYLGMFHNQSSYYPVWIKSATYTLSGTCLEARTSRNPETGNWQNDAFEWGYADNIGKDNLALDDYPNCNRFKISDAIDATGRSVELGYIDFVKIQTGVSSSAGWLGEVSTEVLGVLDLNMLN